MHKPSDKRRSDISFEPCGKRAVPVIGYPDIRSEFVVNDTDKVIGCFEADIYPLTGIHSENACSVFLYIYTVRQRQSRGVGKRDVFHFVHAEMRHFPGVVFVIGKAVIIFIVPRKRVRTDSSHIAAINANGNALRSF